ncbi:GerAB/ArcD/ProY family transporter [Neobacillus kokaensis]|uniref:Germination protein GerKB n=1 Tax=Neobacillus kokaensis TaxID=2759023 RepID=A0ABQ3N655_9BACI|nr:endospore germination permease [Neobacillus kokaensis]GHI00419.1 germination protein GerKB [Neobacillus kokaensis]
MKKTKIDQKQMFSLMFLFILSSIVTTLTPKAGQDAWISIFIGMLGSLILYFFVYTKIYNHNPTLPLTGILAKVFSPYIGVPLSLIYVSYFIYITSIATRHLGDTITTHILSETPIAIVCLIMLLLVSYGCYLGIEVLGRTAEILLIWMFIFGLTGNLSVIASGIIQLKNLQPVLENGWLPVLKDAFPLAFSFPFGEIFLFLMILPHLNKPELARWTGLAALFLSGLSLSWTFFLIISVIGPFGTDTTDIPLLSMVGKINVANFIQRIDSIVVGTFVVGFFIKISLYFYAVVIGLTDIFKIKSYRLMIIPAASIVFISTFFMGEYKQEYGRFRQEILPYIVELPLLIGIPLLLLLTIWVRKSLDKK